MMHLNPFKLTHYCSINKTLNDPILLMQMMQFKEQSIHAKIHKIIHEREI